MIDKEIFDTALTKVVEARRVELGLPVATITRLTGYDRASYHRWIACGRGMTVHRLYTLAEAMNITVEALIERTVVLCHTK